jgi:hypothetical protein
MRAALQRSQKRAGGEGDRQHDLEGTPAVAHSLLELATPTLVTAWARISKAWPGYLSGGA